MKWSYYDKILRPLYLQETHVIKLMKATTKTHVDLLCNLPCCLHFRGFNIRMDPCYHHYQVRVASFIRVFISMKPIPDFCPAGLDMEPF